MFRAWLKRIAAEKVILARDSSGCFVEPAVGHGNIIMLCFPWRNYGR
jgi:hypothetical protein